MNYLKNFILRLRAIVDFLVADLKLTIDKKYENLIND